MYSYILLKEQQSQSFKDCNSVGNDFHSKLIFFSKVALTEVNWGPADNELVRKKKQC